ncbi:MAG: lipoyl(octanoyl) transferase [Zetaproteobacteria bacterium CG12_big_fil_rev_8_21_14_0_65_54_13]|nr:MAG: lipoyl(octanoyl) transferase [Zetaproteobacteria bacterium CG23_combo_of_CG06-09_8_20_14_all_54_7]PIW51313.1 MAG: lipoyl(octanoyl) transferase [Zetaproteobacteria bacterium CG12_big_fil_rev_8_21_14_0_65_54_13]PIX53323.1 MAG: lipoyl(octanoyl) transferase [Zetaproteobacteria bacterium CG_4_10_14_3_um_filter_54_28]PJA29619.1 MAG: lipoyl(octanoyl) transferase [Zetaproteobacteria bacterium CG_4_9_14_3_um_filter_54_145]
MRETEPLLSTRPAWHWLGRQPYLPLWHQMQQRAADIAAGSAAEEIWACEHDPVYTTGRRGIDNRTMRELPAQLIRIDRGGETTFHGPGQLLLYPVIDLRRRSIGVRDYVHMLEHSCIDLLTAFDIDAGRRCGFPGVWIGSGKVAALGIRVSNGVAYHGMALNLDVDMHWFQAIKPCGLTLSAVNASACAELPSPADMAENWSRRFVSLLAG